MKILKRTLVGCLGLIVLTVVGLAVTAGVMVALGPPDSEPGHEAQAEEPLPVQRLPAPIESAPGEVPLPAATAAQVAVELDLEEAEFDIRPGEPGEGIRVEGEYDAGLYELHHETTGEGSARRVRITFRPRYSLMRRLVTVGVKDAHNHIRIFLPPDVALSLTGQISKGESHLRLGGLALTGVDLALTMGDHEVRWDEPNQLSIDRLKLRASMGEFDAVRLGNAHFREARIDGSMGESHIDLRGDYVQDASVVARFSLGEAHLTVPSDVNTQVVRRVLLGEGSGPSRPREAAPEGAPTLKVNGSITMGEFGVHWD